MYKKILLTFLCFMFLISPSLGAGGSGTHSAYLDRYLAEYKPTGEYGGPIE